jgi:hypothetical protein
MNNNHLDDIGVPTTLISVYLNILSMAEIQLIHGGATLFLSCLSGVYLITKIRNERKKGKLLDQDLNEKD